MRINFFGDVCLDGIDVDRFFIDPRIRALTASADCNVANLESPLTLSTDAMPYRAHLIKAEPRPSEILRLFDVFSLANNHIMDYKERGLQDTIALLQELGKGHFGTGADRQQSLAPYIFERDGRRVAFLSFTRWHRATRRTAGTAPDRLRPLTQAIGALRRQGCFVVLYPHWNYEYVDYPAPSNRILAKKLVDAGAHLIVGAHPHILQGYEEYGGRMIFHSIGNFVFHPGQLRRAEPNDARIRRTIILTVNINQDNSYTYDITPVRTDDSGTAVLNDGNRLALLEYLAGISADLADERSYRKRFYKATDLESRKTGKRMQMAVKQQGLFYILSRLHRIRSQDIKIKLHAMRASVAGDRWLSAKGPADESGRKL